MSAAPDLDTRIEASNSTAVDAPSCPVRIAAEVATLPTSAQLARSGDLVAYIAESVEIPSVLQEIGRLRELTFRAVGEGTGRAVDLDAFDQHYRHLFVWDAERSRVVGAYRCAESDTVRRRFGPSGLYSSTLFDYTETDLSTHQSRADLRTELVARMPVYPGSEARSMAARGWNHFDRLEWLSTQIEQIEGQGMGVPLLLAEYMKLGGSFAAFNRDPSFSDVIDGLVVVDLRSADPRLLSIYMGKEASRAFLDGFARARSH